MSLSRDIAVMRTTPLLAGLTEEQLRLLAFSGEAKRLQPGDVLFSANATASGAGVVASGALAVSQDVEAGGRARMVGPGGIINGLALLLEGRQSVHAVAEQPSEVIVLGRSQFRRILTEYPETARELQQRLTQNLMAMTSDLESVRARLADLDARLPAGSSRRTD
ncbi:Crp/Fnr family transcriptional regulator [Amorphus coralli]|uniref:Crp/Fnr family transcriptional regulator n=1 Tax=Amorphus coralli TaxID=340680 RepID=UPI00042761E9|nr:cyclic nucleotide-binding domain-containing protein [Amorphus coralli]